MKFVKAEAPVNHARAPQPAVESAARPAPIARKAAEGTAAPAAGKLKPEPVPFNQDDFKNDPLIQKALEIFKGQIVEVRA